MVSMKGHEIRIFDADAYLCPMRTSPFEPCIPTKGKQIGELQREKRCDYNALEI